MSDPFAWLTGCPAGDENFKHTLKRADTAVVEEALLECARRGRKTSHNALRAELKRRAKKPGAPPRLKDYPDFEEMRKNLGMFKQPTAGELELVRSGDTAVAVIAEPSVAEEFKQAKLYHEMAKVSAAQSLTFMALAGFELQRLKKLHGVKPGQPKKNSSSAGRISWGDLVKREMGIAENTAWRYMELARALRKKLPEIDAEGLLNTPAKDWPELKRAQIIARVGKVTDGQTWTQLGWDLGYVKKPHGHALRGGANTGGGDKGGRRGQDEAEDTEAAAKAEVVGAEGAWNQIERQVRAEMAERTWAHLGQPARKNLKQLFSDLTSQLAQSLKD